MKTRCSAYGAPFLATIFAMLVPDAAVNAQQSPAAVPPAADDTTTQGIEDIIVTAQRREENLQRAAIAISAVNGDALVNAGISEPLGLTRLVPALVVQPTVGTNVNFYLRGVGSFAANPLQENPIAFNYAGIYLARPASPISTFYDLERVEVLKGPQGTLYGRNATGGAINVIPKAPSLEGPTADLLFEYGNYKAKKVTAAVNLVLSDFAALRFAGQIVDRDGYLSDGYDDENGQAVRGSLLLKPNDWLRATILADYFHQGGNGGGSVLIASALAPTAPDPKDRIGGADPRSIAALTAASALVRNGLVVPPQGDGFIDAEFWGVQADVNADIGFATLTILPSYRENSRNVLNYSAGYRLRSIADATQKSLEIRLASNESKPLGYVLGGYLFHEHQVEDFRPVHGPILGTTVLADLTTKSAALFGQLTYSITDTFRIVGGARYTRDTKKSDSTFQQTNSGVVGPLNAIVGSNTFEKLTYKAGVEFDVAERSLLYATLSTGYKSGGFFLSPADNTFRPETLTAYTLGSKNRLFDNRLQVNLEGFYWDYKDQQVNFVGPVQSSPTTVAFVGVTRNAGKSRIYGIEAEINFEPTRRDRFGVNLQYLNAKYTEFTYLGGSANGALPRTNCTVTPSTAVPTTPPARVFTVDCSGRPQINAPKWVANLSYEHEFKLGSGLSLTPGIRTRLESGRFMSPEYLAEEYQKSYRMSDAYVTFSSNEEDWSLTAYVNNIEDRTVYAGTNLRPVYNVVYNNLRPPRTYGLRAGFHF